MKKFYGFFTLFIFSGFFFLSGCNFINWQELPWNKQKQKIQTTKVESKSKTQKKQEKQEEDKEWAVKINDEAITIKEFYDFYYTQNKILLNMTREEIDDLADDSSIENHPTLNKTKFMDFVVSRKLLYDKALKDKGINNEELKTIMKLFKLQGVATYYLSEKLKDEIIITDEDIDGYYKRNKSLFKGVPINDQVVTEIKQRLFMQKFEEKSSEFIMNLIAESKVEKQGFKDHLRKLSEKSENKSELKKDKEDKEQKRKETSKKKTSKNKKSKK